MGLAAFECLKMNVSIFSLIFDGLIIFKHASYKDMHKIG